MIFYAIFYAGHKRGRNCDYANFGITHFHQKQLPGLRHVHVFTGSYPLFLITRSCAVDPIKGFQVKYCRHLTSYHQNCKNTHDLLLLFNLFCKMQLLNNQLFWCRQCYTRSNYVCYHSIIYYYLYILTKTKVNGKGGFNYAYKNLP